MSGTDFSSFSMTDLFRIEVENQGQVLAKGLVDLESDPTSAPLLKELMRAAHSLKGAARIVNYESAVQVAHAMEDCLVAAQKGILLLSPEHIDALLDGLDFVQQAARIREEELPAWEVDHKPDVARVIRRLDSPGPNFTPAPPESSAVAEANPESAPENMTSTPQLPDEARAQQSVAGDPSNRALRIGAENLNRLLGLAGEALLASRRLETFSADLLRLKRRQQEVLSTIEQVRQRVIEQLGAQGAGEFAVLQEQTFANQRIMSERLEELEYFQRTLSGVSNRLYQEVLDSRMRPFGDVVHGFPRMVRDTARFLAKQARLEITGLNTPVDRDIVDRLEAPLNHLLRNALDHGIEDPESRNRLGKRPEGKILLDARHSAGMLLIQVSDDGRGLSPESIRAAVVERKLSSQETADKMSDAELFEFLFLPGFSLKGEVTELSGRGVGLDVVHDMAHQVGGTIRIASRPNEGTQFQLFLPLTLSVLRTLIVEVAGEPYAFPLARIHSTSKLPQAEIETAEGRQHFAHRGRRVGLVTAHQVLGLDAPQNSGGDLPIVVLEDRGSLYGLIVDRVLDERELVVLTLDPRLGKVPNISSAALMPDRSPVLIFDTEDLFRSIENLITGERLTRVQTLTGTKASTRRKRLLVVDDSLTVRELERKLLTGGGYEVDVAVDGMDGWNAARVGQYDLVVTDVDMPRMDGIELVTMIRSDSRMKSVPVVIVSYKDRPEDRKRGLEAGADYYLTKGSFQDETLLQAVRDLIGRAQV